jgi:protein SCO1/2
MDRRDLSMRRALILLSLLVALPVVAQPRELLVDQYGHPVPAQALTGKFLLVYFGYTSCPDLCPAALATMTTVLERLGPAGDRIQPLFVTVDPAHDTVAVLRRYASHFHPRLWALTGSPQAIAAAARSFEVQYREGPNDASGRRVVDHSVFLYLADPQGRVVQQFHPRQSAAEIVAAVRPRLQFAGSPAP